MTQGTDVRGAGRLRRALIGAAIAGERRWDAARHRRRAHRPPTDLRIDAYLGHGTASLAVVRGRILDDPKPTTAVEGEGMWAALRRTLSHFTTDELPGVALRVRVGATERLSVSDDEGYFEVRVHPELAPGVEHWATASVELAAPYRGISAAHAVTVPIRLSGGAAAFGIISDVDDTIMHTGAQRTFEMIRRTLTGSELTRAPLPGAPELYRALAGGDVNPVFYVSSSPWNLHDFLVSFLRRRAFPLGPLLLRDLLGAHGDRTHATSKLHAIEEVLELHPDLRFVLIGDSGQHDPEVYAEVVRRHPRRVVAVYVREVRLDPGDGRVEAVSDTWDHEVPFVLAPDSSAVAAHAASLGLITVPAAADIERAVLAAGSGDEDRLHR